ncbi:LysE/ArgO family amino acid transporter [Paenibacillus sp. J22TS3]|uniref:LysE/ArgO family amino acid transporter n=1 Tax=Paenibacillus sp. J22TS3 TaxID=2807192 RepID=UPI001B262F8F|nr:LysE/ArgO family amino acid transporter [Paenibacillus sp. J22TS3]GIP23483.1 LysE/yggA protein [Paenibacillus sp. J22TS3]
MIEAVIHGIILALGLILPLGVQNVFVFNQGAAAARWPLALPVVVAASLCDTLLILLSVFGVSLLLLSVAWLKLLLFAAGVMFLVYMGWSIWKSEPSPSASREERLPARKQILFAVSVSLLNPHAIMDTIGVIGTNALGYEGQAKWGFTLGCIGLSWIWFSALALAGRWVGSLDRAGKILKVINKVSAVIIWAVAVYLAVQFMEAIG